MKNSFKLIALVLAIIMVSVSLCSCRALDEAKANHGFYTDSTETEILMRENIYRELELGKLRLIDSGSSVCYITEKDVPTLLSSWYSGWYSISDDETVISSFGNSYVREDKFEAVKEVADKSVLDHYYVSYYHYPDSYDSTSFNSMIGDYYEVDNVSTVLLDQDVTDTINIALKTADKDQIQLKVISVQTMDALIINRCDKDMIVTADDSDVVLLRDGEKYYVADYNYHTWNDESSVCPVEKDGAALIKELFEKYPEAVDQTAF